MGRGGFLDRSETGWRSAALERVSRAMAPDSPPWAVWRAPLVSQFSLSFTSEESLRSITPTFLVPSAWELSKPRKAGRDYDPSRFGLMWRKCDRCGDCGRSRLKAVGCHDGHDGLPILPRLHTSNWEAATES